MLNTRRVKLYIHEFRVSSGKSHKVITKVYDKQLEAYSNFYLLGGTLVTTEVIKVEEEE